jgi:hypothetical protein
MTDNKVECECGTLVLPCSMKAHLKTKKHQDLLQVMGRREEEKQLSQRERDQAEKQEYIAKVEKLQKTYSKWHEVYEYDENDMVGHVSGTRIKLWYYTEPSGLIITPDNSVREWTLYEKPWGHEYDFSVPFAFDHEIEIKNRNGVTLFRFRKQDDERDETDDDETEDDVTEDEDTDELD